MHVRLKTAKSDQEDFEAAANISKRNQIAATAGLDYWTGSGSKGQGQKQIEVAMKSSSQAEKRR